MPDDPKPGDSGIQNSGQSISRQVSRSSDGTKTDQTTVSNTPPPMEKKVAFQKKWGDTQGYGLDPAGTKQLKNNEPSLGALYYKAEASSEVSYDLDKKEANLTVIKGAVTGSLVHGEAAKSFDLGQWVKNLFGEPPAKTVGGGAPMAARVGDPTTHGSPLAPGIGSPNVMIGYKPAWRTVTDMHACPVVKGVVPDVGGVVMVGAPTVFINFFQACRVGDLVVEIPGGPNPIVMGCPTVMIGMPASAISVPNSTGLKLGGKVTGDELTASAEANVGAVFNSQEQSVSAQVGAGFALLSGTAEGSITIPLWGQHSLTLGVVGKGSVGTLAARAGASAGHTAEGGWKAQAGGELGAALFGGGVSGSIEFK